MPPITGTVLVIDDEAAVRQSLKFALEQEGLEVRLYENGAQLLADGELPSSGCLVVDLAMPGIDGIELVGRLRGRHVALPALLITTPGAPGLHERALRAGFRLVLEKPLEDDALLNGITAALLEPSRIIQDRISGTPWPTAGVHRTSVPATDPGPVAPGLIRL